MITPGTFPCKASSRKEMRDKPNFRITARGLPVKEHRLTSLTAEEFLGNLVSFAWQHKNLLRWYLDQKEFFKRFTLSGKFCDHRSLFLFR